MRNKMEYARIVVGAQLGCNGTNLQSQRLPA
jgi:hypothetical protein